MKVVLVNHSDNNGGAAVVTYRLMYALKKAGIDASMLVYTKYSGDNNVLNISRRWIRGLLFTLERVRIYFSNGFNRDNLFKVSTADFGHGVASHQLVKEADIVVFSWVNQGLFSFSDIKKISDMGKPIVWTMHDMWCMTGICHHSLKCRNFTNKCGNCMFLGTSAATDDLSHKIWKKKKRAYSQTPISFVAVSNWLKEQAKQSSLLSDKSVEVIHNAFPIDTFPTEIDVDSIPFGLNNKTNYILMGAARLDDHIKGLGYAIEALNILFDEHPDIANTSEVLFFGGIRDENAFNELRFPYRHLGILKDPAILRKLYATGKVVLSSSLFETLPGTLIEGMATGCLPVTFDRGGQRDIVEHKRNGYIARFGDTRDFANGIRWALNTKVDRRQMHDNIGRKFSSDIIAKQYIELFNRLLAKKNINAEPHTGR